MSKKYISFKSIGLEYDTAAGSFTLTWAPMGTFLKNGGIRRIKSGEAEFSLADYKKVETAVKDIGARQTLEIKYSDGPVIMPSLSVIISVGESDVDFGVKCPISAANPAAEHNVEPAAEHTTKPVTELEISLTGELNWGCDPENSTFAVKLDKKCGDLRVAHGPAVSKIDNALFDRLTDNALELLGGSGIGCRVRLSYDWKNKKYLFDIKAQKPQQPQGQVHNSSKAAGAESEPVGERWFETGIVKLVIHKDYFHNKTGIHYAPINKKTQFPTPPAGWMTWYSVKFDACEKVVLENTKWMAENLKPYGANCIWVDWEWCHNDFSGQGLPGVDLFNPDSGRYPNGLGYVAKEIAGYGFIPAIWMQMNDVNKNEYLNNHEEWILANDKKGCGQWWADPSNAGVVSEYVPAIFKKLMADGYEVFKWDFTYAENKVGDMYHDKYSDITKTPDEALRDVIKSGRETVGYDKYMLHVGGSRYRDYSLAPDIFDAIRIGNDVFKWEEFVKYAVKQMMDMMRYHNVIFYADIDNIIVRDEFNDLEQAKSRVSFAALTGAPFTIGDDLTSLKADRVELLKRAIPVIDIHPKDLEANSQDCSLVILNLSVAKIYGNWNIVDIFNTTSESRDVRIDIGTDLHLDTEDNEKYVMYDYWDNEFIGIYDGVVEFRLGPYSSKVISIHLLKSIPQVISTSRHITQGACDIIYLEWDEKCAVLKGKSRVVKDDRYDIILQVPDGYTIGKDKTAGIAQDSGNPAGDLEVVNRQNNIWRVGFMPVETGETDWEIRFSKKENGLHMPFLDKNGNICKGHALFSKVQK